MPDLEDAPPEGARLSRRDARVAPPRRQYRARLPARPRAPVRVRRPAGPGAGGARSWDISRPSCASSWYRGCPPARWRATSRACGGFYRFLVLEGRLMASPADDVHAPRAWPALPRFLSLDEVDRLLEQPDGGRPAGLRDRALLELLYATGHAGQRAGGPAGRRRRPRPRSAHVPGEGRQGADGAGGGGGGRMDPQLPGLRAARPPQAPRIDLSLPERAGRGSPDPGRVLEDRQEVRAARPGSRGSSAPTRCGIPSPPTSSSGERTCASSRPCWAMPTCPPRRSTPTFSTHGYGRSTRSSIRGLSRVGRRASPCGPPEIGPGPPAGEVRRCGPAGQSGDEVGAAAAAGVHRTPPDLLGSPDLPVSRIDTPAVDAFHSIRCASDRSSRCVDPRRGSMVSLAVANATRGSAIRPADASRQALPRTGTRPRHPSGVVGRTPAVVTTQQGAHSMRRTGQYLFTSESVTEGHPDKIADRVSDGIVDAVLAQDPQGRVACETLLTTGLVVVAGEITCNGSTDFTDVVRGRDPRRGVHARQVRVRRRHLRGAVGHPRAVAGHRDGGGPRGRRRPGADVRLRVPRDRVAHAAADIAGPTTCAGACREPAATASSTTCGPTASRR